jgi:hypothetical protein
MGTRSRRLFTKEFKLGILAEIMPAQRSRRSPAATTSIPKRSANGSAESASTVIVRLPAMATRIPTKLVLPSSSARSADSQSKIAF